jgi:rhodanese-related sulfurtransferase
MQELTTFISSHLLLSLATAIVLALVMVVEFLRAKRVSSQLTPLQATQMINHDHAVVIDIRPSDAYRGGHIIDAASFTPGEIRDNAKKLEKWKTKPIILVCGNGLESQKLAALLLKRGYNAYSLASGMRAWSEAQMPLVKE